MNQTLIFILFFCVHFCWSSRIQIVNNGYENILVALPDDVSKEGRVRIVKSLQDILNQASTILYDATKGRAYFRSVTFLIPVSWNDVDSWFPNDWSNMTHEAGGIHHRNRADIVVAENDGHPYVLHHLGCGKDALRIQLQASRIINDESLHDKGMKFVQLWSEFRYGVFPEGGFINDELFPDSFRIPGTNQNHTTGCRKPPLGLLEEETEEERSSICEETVSCSIMDQHLRPKTGAFCEAEMSLGLRHDNASPSKQNLLCNENGVWFTILKHPDFKNGKNAAQRDVDIPKISFNFVKERTYPKVLVVIDASTYMNQNRYALTKNAFAQFVLSVLPDGSELSLMVFGEDTQFADTRDCGQSDRTHLRVITNAVVLQDDVGKIAYLETDPLPDEPSSMDIGEFGLDDVLISVAKTMRDDMNMTSMPNVIFITSNTNIKESKSNDVHQILQDVQVNFLAFTRQQSKISGVPLHKISSETDSRFVDLDTGDSLSNLYRGMAESMETGILIDQQYLSTIDDETISMPFIVDSDVTDDMWITLSGPNFENPPLNFEATNLQDPKLKTVLPVKQQLVPAWVFRVKNAEMGEYILKTRRKRGGTSPVLVTITIPKISQNTITTKLWVDTHRQIPSTLYPNVQVVAEVRRGEMPVKDAAVAAFITHPDANSFTEIRLLDNGLGNVDITKDDGLYSGFFSNFTSIGYYNVYLKVSEGMESIAKIIRGPSSPCCGSFYPWSTEEETHQFHRLSGPATFYVGDVPLEDVVPPARVTDLKVIRAVGEVAVMQWSAVGDDWDKGVASAYELKLFRDRTILRNRFEESELALYSESISTTPEAVYGTIMYNQVKFPKKLARGIYYFGIRALDDAGNYGEVSNIASVYVDLNEEVASINCKDEPVAERYQGANCASLMSYEVLIVCAVFIVLLFD